MSAAFTTDDHRRFFAEFCKYELASGGPDPQLAMVADMANTDTANDNERQWRAFCYIGPYNVPYAEVIWQHWTYGDALAFPKQMEEWLIRSFAEKKITTRNERKTVRRPEWMEEYLSGAVSFIKRGEFDRLREKCAALPPRKAYEVAWDVITKRPRIGRYTGIKLIEYMRRYLGLAVESPDIRPKDAWSPRHTLGYIFPDRGLGNESNSPEALKMARQSCEDAITLLNDEYGVLIDMFQLQVLLCEYRESWESKKQYPGRSLDSELGYARRAESEWGRYKSSIWQTRKKLFPHAHLGELNGWDGPRKEVGRCLSVNHYTWTDLLFDYKSTTDMAKPMYWGQLTDARA